MQKLYWIIAFVSINTFSGCSLTSGPESLVTPYGHYYSEEYLQEQKEKRELAENKAIAEQAIPDNAVKTKVVYKTKWRTKWKTKGSNVECKPCTGVNDIVNPSLKLGHHIRKKELSDGKYTVMYTNDFKKLEKVYDNIYDDNTKLRSR